LSDDYLQAFDQMLDAPATNSISLRILYFLDYSFVKKLLTRKQQTAQ
jgi:hypothetical protein